MSQYGAGLYLQVILLINIPFGDKYNYWSYLAKIFSCKYQKYIPSVEESYEVIYYIIDNKSIYHQRALKYLFFFRKKESRGKLRDEGQ